MRRLKEIQDFLSDVPGPSPWYLAAMGPNIEGYKTDWLDGEKFTKLKRTGKQNKSFTGKTVLLINDRPRLILDFQCYVQKMEDNNLLIWYEQTDDKTAENLEIRILLIDLNKLEDIDSPDNIAEKLNQNNKVGFIGQVISEFSIDKNLDFGIHDIEVPNDLKEIDEFLIFAKSVSNGQESNYWDKMSLALYIVNFKEHKVEIVPQDWFNNGNFDFMYQWPTRVKREPKTNRIFGDGFRIGGFKLTKNNRQIKKWYN